MSLSKKLVEVGRFSIVICRNAQKKYLCVQEANGLWWVPGGGVESGETHFEAAVR
jgi:8-oxo-dGTP pyrophosphatase MutT (NUDIX family)